MLTPGLSELVRNGQIDLVSSDSDTYTLIDRFIDKHSADSAFYIVNLSKVIQQFHTWKSTR